MEASEEASKDGPARAKFKRSRVGIPTVSQHLHLAPCLELGYADGAATYMADVVFAFSTRAAHDSAKRVRTARKHEVRDRPPVFLFVHWHEAAHVVGGDLALPFQVTFLQRLESISQMPNRNRKIWTLRVQVRIDLESRSLREVVCSIFPRSQAHNGHTERSRNADRESPLQRRAHSRRTVHCSYPKC